MGLFDDIGAALENFGDAKDEAINKVTEHVGEVVPEEVQNVGDAVQSLDENEQEQNQE